MRGIIATALAAVTAASAAMAGTGLSETSVRAFVARQEAAWNRADVRAFAATFAPDAVFVDQARNSNGGVTANGSSTLAQTLVQARRYFAKTKFHETAFVDRVEVAVNGHSARVLGHTTTLIEVSSRPARVLCAETEQTVIMAKVGLMSKGQTETDVRCPRSR